jgi:hypothetical protein
MSYDLMVFDPKASPLDRPGFIEWYEEQIQWNEGHSYQDPRISTPELRGWFLEMIEKYPAMNGPYASDDADNPSVTDYSVGRSVIYAAFAWSVSEEAFKTMFRLAQDHRLGFFDVSTPDGGVWLPNPVGNFICVHGRSAGG